MGRAASRAILALAFGGGVAVAAATAGWAWWSSPREERSAAALMDAVMWNTEPIGGAFSLTDHTGKPRTDADFRGKVLLIYFGFTYCSDVCPIDLQSMASAVDQLGPDNEGLQPLFITVDPAKDTPEQIAGYVALFHPRLIGLTGTSRQIREVTRAYRVYYAKTELDGKAEASIDHSGFVFLVSGDGRYLGFLPPSTPADRMAAAIRPHLARARP